MSTRPLKKAVREAQRLRPLRFLARAGFAVNGLVHVIIGFIAIGVAFSGVGSADQSGALGQLAASPGGMFTLWIVTVALAALGVWLILGAFLVRSSDPKKRVARFIVEAGKGLAYLILAGTALTFARGGSTSGEADVDSMSATLLATPGGMFLLLILAAVVLAVGVYFVLKGARQRFVDDIDLPSGAARKPTMTVGIFGYVAKGIAVGIVGILLGIASLRNDPSQASGLDGSLKALVALPFGKVILTIIGLGLISYGVYCILRARIARL